MPSAKKDAKKRNEAAMKEKSQQGGKGQGKGQGQGKAVKQRNDIVPWGWEEEAKQTRKKAVAERSAAEAAARAAKEAAANPDLAQKAVKKQPDAKPAADAKPADGKAKA
ncbi:hypothetical protein N2152v2_006921 [Parachlorella kessleri]